MYINVISYVLLIGHHVSCWRFVPSQFGLPTPRDIIELDASPAGPDDYWDIHGSSCRIRENRPDGHLKLECAHGGLHEITRFRYSDNGTVTKDTKYLTVQDHPFCFTWYIHHQHHWVVKTQARKYNEDWDKGEDEGKAGDKIPDYIKNLHHHAVEKNETFDHVNFNMFKDKAIPMELRGSHGSRHSAHHGGDHHTEPPKIFHDQMIPDYYSYDSDYGDDYDVSVETEQESTEMHDDSMMEHVQNDVGHGTDHDHDNELAATYYIEDDFFQNDFERYQKFRPYHTVDHLLIWVMDPHIICEEERNGSARFPSEPSALLTKELKSLGEEPSVSIKTFGLTRLHANHHVYLAKFSDHGYWEVFIESTRTPSEVLVSVQGAHVAVNDCFIKRTTKNIMRKVFDLNTSPNGSSEVYYSGRQAVPFFRKSPCAKNVALMVNSSRQVMITQDSFTTSVPLYVQAVNIESTLDVEDIVLVNEYIVMRKGTTLYRVAFPKNITEVFTDVLPTDVAGINSRQACTLEFGVNMVNNMVLAWTASSIYYSLDIAAGLVEINVPNEYLGAASHVVSANIGNLQYIIIIRIYDASVQKAKIVQYMINHERWSDLTSIPSNNTVIDWLLFIEDSPNFIVLTEGGVFQYDAVADKLTSAEFDTEGVIKEVFVDVLHKSRFFVMLEKTLLYGSLVSRETYTIDLSEYMDDDDDIIWIEERGLLYFIQHGTRVMFPWLLELLSAAHPHIYCQQLDFVYSKKETNFLDRSDKIQMWVAATNSEYHTTDQILKADYTHSELVHVEKRLKVGEINHYRTENMTITLSVETHDNKSLRIPSRKAQVSFVEISAVKESIACPSDVVQNRAVYVGCPPGKHVMTIRNEFDPEYCEQFKHNNKTIKISRAVFDERLRTNDSDIVSATYTDNQVYEIELKYNYKEYGCPNRHLITDLFNPRLMLYDDQMEIEEVQVDFVMYEVFNSQEIRYVNTSKQLGCSCQSQTWDMMKTQFGDDVSPMDMMQIWGPHNYKSCFRECPKNDTGRLASTPYQIFNAQRNVLLKPPVEGNGFLFFHVIVVDPTYSFCRLTTKFSVEVYGALPDLDLHLVFIVLFTCIITVFIALFLSYLQLRKIMLADSDSFSMRKRHDDF